MASIDATAAQGSMPRDRRVRLFDVLKAAPSLIPDAPRMASSAVRLLTMKPSTVASVGLVFQRAAHKHPERVFLRFVEPDGTVRELTYGDANELVNRYASVLSAHGVGDGEVVGILATNRPETLLVALATVKLGGIAGMLNHHQRGEVLNHSQRLLNSRVLVVGTECAEALHSLPKQDLRGTVLRLPDDQVRSDTLAEYPSLAELARYARDSDPPQCAQVRAADKAFYIFTSGTTGLPKASTMSHLRWLKSMTGIGGLGVRLRPSDTLYCCLPLYHNNALTVSLSSVLSAGATLALGRSFSVSRFWSEVVRTEATAFVYIGELCRYLLNAPEKPAEREHQVRVVVGNGLRPEIWTEFTRRFGIRRVAEFYGASECNLAFINALNLDRTAGITPLPFAVVAYDPVTEQPVRTPAGRLRKVKTGEIGLLLTKITHRSPFDGYTDPDATEQKVIRDAFKPGDAWFNTGDLVRKQGWNHVAFADRLGDTFRWKGENVATTEVEAVLSAHPDIEQAVVFGVSVPGTDGKAGMAAVKLVDGAKFDPQGTAAHLVQRLPSYAVPLFIRIIDEVEQTSTFKSRKVDLRAEGFDPGKVSDPLYVLPNRDSYVEFYPEYPGEVASGSVRI